MKSSWLIGVLAALGLAGRLAVTYAQRTPENDRRAPIVAEESVIPLDGAWRFQPAGGDERAMPVPSFWERQQSLRDVHRGVYRRSFDVPDSFQGRRIVLRFDAVGDAAEVSVNGQAAGGHVGADLPFELDVTGLVSAPSAGNRLEVDVRDDTHFSVPRPSNDFRNRKSWIPRGMGANNRKGLYQSVTLRAAAGVAGGRPYRDLCAEARDLGDI
jgi:hypothetical protein